MKRMNSGKLLGRVLVLCAGIALAGSVRADIITIAAWDFENEATRLEPSTAASNVIVPDLALGGSWSWSDLSEETITNNTGGNHAGNWSRVTGTASGGVLHRSASQNINLGL